MSRVMPGHCALPAAGVALLAVRLVFGRLLAPQETAAPGVAA